MSFRRLFIIFEICSFSYFVFANPELCMRLIREGPAAIKVIASNPQKAFQVITSDNGRAAIKAAFATPPKGEASPAPAAQAVSQVATSEVAVNQNNEQAADVHEKPASEVSTPVAQVTPSAPDNKFSEQSEETAKQLTGAATAQATDTETASVALPGAQAIANSNALNAAPPAPDKKISAYDQQLKTAYAAAGDEPVVKTVDQAKADTAKAALVPGKTVVFQIERKEIPTRFLHLIIGGSTLRFHIMNDVSDKEIGLAAESLKNACLKSAPTDPCAKGQSSVAIERRFFVDIKEAEVAEWASSTLPASGLIWRLTCVSGKNDCLTTSSRARAFKLTLARASEHEVTLARGFESRAQFSAGRKVSARAPASVQARKVLRAYVTRALNARTAVNDAGSL